MRRDIHNLQQNHHSYRNSKNANVTELTYVNKQSRIATMANVTVTCHLSSAFQNDNASATILSWDAFSFSTYLTQD